VTTWEHATQLVRANGAGPIAVQVEREGTPITLNPTLIAQDRPSPDDPSKIEKNAGFLGVSPLTVTERQNVGFVVATMWDTTARTAQALAQFPERLGNVWDAAFSGAKRDINSPASIVGAGRIGGEIAASAAPLDTKIISLIQLLALVNLAIGMFNLVPLLPLDGGHIAGALWEGLKRAYARVRRRPAPSYVDIAKALPLTYAVVAVLLVMSTLLIYADIVNPIRLSG
jgi:membrane-associated protease RseP (regulator of RpoE activity)